jgi:hypothetical protein
LKSCCCRTATLEKKATAPLPHRDVRKKSYRAATAPRLFIKKSYRDATAYKKILPRRCRDGFQKNVPNFTPATVLDQKYWY